MSFCIQCGNLLKVDARFCGKCGTEIKKQEIHQSSETMHNQLSASNNNPVNHLQNTGNNLNKKKQKYNMKVMGVILAVSLIIGFYVFSPKQLTEQEYEDLAIELLVKDNLAMDNFSNAIDYSGIHIGMDPAWSEEYKQLVEPAKNLEKDFEELNEILEDVKPPEYFEYEHETLMKVFNAHKSMASNIGSYMAKGDEEYMESSEEYESRADEYLEESIFITEEYEEQILETYQKTRLD